MSGIRLRSLRTSTIGGLLAAALLLPLSACGGHPASRGGAGDASPPAVTVGSANFPENQLLAEMYSQALEAAHVKVTRTFNIGGRGLCLKALEQGSISMVPEYNGALLAALSEDGVVPRGLTTTSQVDAALQKVLPSGLGTLTSSPAEYKDTLAVTGATAHKYHVHSIPDLKPVAGKLVLGAGPEFKTRYQGVLGLKKVYGLSFTSFTSLDPGGPLTTAALRKNQIQVADIFSTDSTIRTDKLVALDDPEHLFLAQNITPLVAKAEVKGKVAATINAVSAALDTKALTTYLAEVAVDKLSYQTVAREFLDANDLD